MRKDFLVFGSPLIEQPEIDEVIDTLKSGWIGTGPKTHRFEDDLKLTSEPHMRLHLIHVLPLCI